MSAARLFAEIWGEPPTGVWSAPGRVNLIGEHTDYNDGLVLPFAIDGRAAVAAALVEDDQVAVASAQQPGQIYQAPLPGLRPGRGTGWPDYVFGVVWALREQGHRIPGIRMAIDSTVPVGAGLSSSAALECAAVLAATQLIGVDLRPEDVARAAQRAENDFVGMPCGLMDQMASSACTAGHLLYFDVRAGSTAQVPFDPGAQGYAVLIVDTTVKHSLTDGAYAARRASCVQAAAELGVSSLRDLEFADLPRIATTVSSELLLRRVRHVVTENDRVSRTVDLLGAGQLSEIGPLMLASHASLRDDYEVSDPALDLAVDVTMNAGALGARMTGGGFGGSAIALVPVDRIASISAAVSEAFAAAALAPPILRTAAPSRGAARDI